MDEVVLQYQITWEEFRGGQMRAIPNRGYLMIAVLTFGPILIGVTTGDAFWIYYGVAFALFFFLMASFIGPKRYWNAAIGFQEPRTVTINDEGVTSKSASLEMKLPWSRFGYVRESKGYFTLMPKKKLGAFMIVKRGLSSTSDEQTLRRLLETHLTIRRTVHR
jgi:hypothetical protein